MSNKGVSKTQQGVSLSIKVFHLYHFCGLYTYWKHRFDTKISVSIKPFFFARIGANSDN